jgi:hypothetical protein
MGNLYDWKPKERPKEREPGETPPVARTTWKPFHELSAKERRELLAAREEKKT